MRRFAILALLLLVSSPSWAAWRLTDAQMAEIQTQLDAYEKALKESKQEIEALNLTIEGLEKNLASSQTIIEGLKQTLQEQQDKLVEQARELEALRTQQKEYEKSLQEQKELTERWEKTSFTFGALFALAFIFIFVGR